MDNERTDYLSTQIGRELNVLSPIFSNHSIFKIPEHLRNVKKEAYEPCIVAIGPYHRDKENLEVMEKNKKWYLKRLLDRRGENDVNRYVTTMRELETEARASYATEFINIKTDNFVEMMLLDSCFIVELFRNTIIYALQLGGDIDDPILRFPLIHNAVVRDLVLLENQLPFFVLRKFFTMTMMPNENITYFATMIYVSFSPVLQYYEWEKMSSLINENSIQNIKHLVALLHDYWSPLPLEKGMHDEYIHCATKLKEAGIKFKKVEESNVFKVIFENGVMKIPKLEIKNETETLFRNLIAYEQSILNANRTYISDYARLMDCLINSQDDVELLHEIFDNRLADDEMVVNIFNRLSDFLKIPSICLYHNLYKDVREHCNSIYNTWMANLRHNYFNTPWTIISFFAGLLLLLLTTAQTIFSAMSLNK